MAVVRGFDEIVLRDLITDKFRSLKATGKHDDAVSNSDDFLQL